MSRDSDVARLTDVLGAPGFRYRNFTNAAVRPTAPARTAASPINAAPVAPASTGQTAPVRASLLTASLLTASLPASDDARAGAPTLAVLKGIEAPPRPAVGITAPVPRIRAVPASPPRAMTSTAPRFALLEALLATDAAAEAVVAVPAPPRRPDMSPPREGWAAVLCNLTRNQDASQIATPLVELLRRAASAPGQ